MQPPPGIAPYLDDLHQLIHSTFSGKQRLQQHQNTFVKNARHLPNTRHTLSLNSFRLNSCYHQPPSQTHLNITNTAHPMPASTHTKHLPTPVTTARSVPVRVEARPSHNPSTIYQWRSCTRLLQISAQEHGSTASRCTRCSALLSPAQQLLLSPHTDHTPCAPCPLAINNLRLPVHHTIPTGTNTAHPYPTTSLPSLANHNKTSLRHNHIKNANRTFSSPELSRFQSRTASADACEGSPAHQPHIRYTSTPSYHHYQLMCSKSYNAHKNTSKPVRTSRFCGLISR